MQYVEYYNQQIQHMYTLYQRQNSEMQSLKTQLSDLQETISQLPKQGVGTIEYKFDQLKIENLNGTLHIGLSPENLEDMDGLQELQQQEQGSRNVMPDVKQKTLTEISNHLYRHGPQMIHHLTEKYQYPVDQTYATFILQDIEKQLPTRIAYHVEQAKQNGKTEEKDVHQFTLDALRKEIDQSLSSYFQQQNKGDGK